MNLYPALSARMGTWNYFVVKLTMREVAEHVKLASDIYDDHTLDEALQRILNESRAKKEIVEYLRQDHRFFSSLVIAATEGKPRWYPIMLADDPQFAIFQDDERLNSTFGVLKFDGTQKYYALDGQHRLTAIKTMLDPANEAYGKRPAGFADEEISVIVVHPKQDEEDKTFMLRYRRLFGNLNRHAKPTSHFTNIVMDEDDTFAILTRRLITEHSFFTSPGRHQESKRIKMRKGKNIEGKSKVFTSLEQLYAMNKTLLISKKRDLDGWSLKAFTTSRRNDDELDQLYDELVDIWDAVIKTLPGLKNSPDTMRCHDREGIDEDASKQVECLHDGCCDDSALFWPATQDMIARLIRWLLDESSGSTVERLEPLASLEFSLHRLPWRHLFLIPNISSGDDDRPRQPGGPRPRGPWKTRGPWKIRSEQRKDVVAAIEQILTWQLGFPLTSGERDDLRADWKELLFPQWGESDFSKERRQQMWDQIESAVRRR